MATETNPVKVGSPLLLIEGNADFPTTRAALQRAPMLFERPGSLRMTAWEALLAHSVKDSPGRACNRFQFADQRRVLMQQWADYRDRWRGGAQVIPILTAGCGC